MLEEVAPFSPYIIRGKKIVKVRIFSFFELTYCKEKKIK